MSFQYTSEHRDAYFQQGLTILRALIPPTLLADLRRETDKARELAREQHGAQAQRLQPIYAYTPLDPRPFRDFLTLPGLRAAVDDILEPDRPMSDIMGVLFEPREQAWSTNWHRDSGHHVPNMDMARFFEGARNPKMFNQLNGALYDDSSLWVVPGSHNREDTPEERAAFERIPTPGPTFSAEMSAVERELTCTEYIRKMPGAQQVVLQAGDVAFYRACGWHIGAYVPYTKRATLHDGFYGAEDLAWHEQVRQMQQSAARA